jgi:hypothetical protein
VSTSSWPAVRLAAIGRHVVAQIDRNRIARTHANRRDDADRAPIFERRQVVCGIDDCGQRNRRDAVDGAYFRDAGERVGAACGSHRRGPGGVRASRNGKYGDESEKATHDRFDARV